MCSHAEIIDGALSGSCIHDGRRLRLTRQRGSLDMFTLPHVSCNRSHFCNLLKASGALCSSLAEDSSSASTVEACEDVVVEGRRRKGIWLPQRR